MSGWHAGADCIAAALLPRRQPSNGKADTSGPAEDLYIVHGDGRLLRHRLQAVPASVGLAADDNAAGCSFGSTPDTVLRCRPVWLPAQHTCEVNALLVGLMAPCCAHWISLPSGNLWAPLWFSKTGLESSDEGWNVDRSASEEAQGEVILEAEEQWDLCRRNSWAER